MSLLFWRKTRDIHPENALSVAVTEDTPLPVRPIQDEDDADLRISIEADRSLPRIADVKNHTLTSADTEYTAGLPAGCRRFEWQCRTAADVRYAYETGHVASSVAPYMTLKAGDYYDSGILDKGRPSQTLYLASATAGVVVELTIWQ